MFIYYFSKINPFIMVPRLSWCFGTPSATSLSSTIGSTSARTIYIHKLFFKDKSILSSFRVNQDALGHPRRPRQTQLWLVQHVPVMFIKIWHGTCFFTTLSKTDRLKTVPVYYRLIKCSQTPSATLASSTIGTTAITYHLCRKV